MFGCCDANLRRCFTPKPKRDNDLQICLECAQNDALVPHSLTVSYYNPLRTSGAGSGGLRSVCQLYPLFLTRQPVQHNLCLLSV